ncbi:MAG: hypothetical protein R3F61_37645 [Myxococcota bacterium]
MGYDDPWDASVLEHGDIEALAPNLWWVWSACPGAPVRRNMAVIRLPDGGLILHSPTCLDDERMAAIDALGPVRFLLVPSAGHRSDLKRFAARYPDAKVIAPRNARAEVEKVGPVHEDCEAALPPLGIGVQAPDGMKDGYELVYTVPLDDGGSALVVNDVLGGSHPHPVPGFQGFLGKMLGPPGGELGMARIVRFMFGKDMVRFRAFVSALAEQPDLRVLFTSHGGPVTEDVPGALRAAAARI